MTVVFVTGMSGTGKSSALAELARRGHRVVDTDYGGWIEGEPEPLWREDRIRELLDEQGDETLFISGCVANQGRFYDRFDAVVLLSAPADVLLARVGARITNPYGKTAAERDLILEHAADVEPLLRRTCTHELDATRPLNEVVAELIRIGSGSARG